MNGPARAWCLLALAACLAACEQGRFAGVAPRRVEAAAGSLAPGFSLLGDSLYLTWVQPEHDSTCGLWCSPWQGSGWAKPALLVSGKGWFVNWADSPTALFDDGIITVAWLERLGSEGHAYGAKFRRSSWTGADASASPWLHSDTSAVEHGFVSLVPGEAGVVHAVWLDGRETTQGGPTTLWSATLLPQGPPQHETLLDSCVCDCCPTAAVRCADGSVLVAYRDRSPEEVRDIAVTRLEGDRWSEPRSVYRDEWRLAGCPVNGPALAANDSLVAVAWFTMSGGVDPTVNVAFSADCGRRFGAPVRVDHHHPQGRVDVAWLADAAVVVWVESQDSVATLWARRVFPGGGADSALAVTAVSTDRSSGVPRVACVGGRILVAWTEASEVTRVRTAEIRF